MNVYPALQFQMGNWAYFVVKMTTREVTENVKFASEIHDDRTLDTAIQRILNTSRVKKEIVTYLQRQPWRFFSSIVVAALKGDPVFYPVDIAEDPRFEMVARDTKLNQSFGLLAFNGEQTYYALDGQHRLAAMRTALDRNDDISAHTPPDFKDDEISVLIVVPNMDDTEESFLEKYRRLFANLNRYAKPMDNATNIIMDEDDAFAIVTRRLIAEHEFFAWHGRALESERVKTTRGKNLKTGESYFTSIEVLYDMNTALLDARFRQNEKWLNGEERMDIDQFKRFRPDDELIDELYEELVLYWDAIINEIPELTQEPTKMRSHSVLDDGASADEELHDHDDHALFWPIGQMILADVVREALDRRQADPSAPTNASVSKALAGIGELPWSFQEVPWRDFILIYESKDDGSGKWKIRNEDRKNCMAVAKRTLLWLLGIDELDEAGLVALEHDWKTRLVGVHPPDDDAAWEEVLDRQVG